MIQIEDEIFLKKKFDFEKLKTIGFSFENDKYVYSEDFMNENFKAILYVSSLGTIKGEVIDNFSNEEYMPLRIESYDGEYVYKVREAYKDILKRIADACCKDVFFSCNQANRITNLIYETYGIKPDFPWKDDNGVFRHLDNNKWFSLIMYVSLDVLLKNGDSHMLNIMNVKIDEAKRDELHQIKGIYPAYHMNHRMWISVVLDDTISDEKVMELVTCSFNLTK